MRHTVPAADALLDQPTRVLDHGFVTLVDYQGSDARIVEAARVSISGEGVRPVSEDKALIRYLLSNRHTTPFEMVEFLFHCKMPIFVARQWIRHRMASVNEMSARYSELPEEFYVPDTNEVCYQDKKNKQGRAAQVDQPLADAVRNSIDAQSASAFDTYRGFLGKHPLDEGSEALKAGGGLARELARTVLPLGTYTTWYWKIDLHNLMHFMGLRLDAHAQYEIRVYAEAMVGMVKAVAPIAWEAFEDFRLGAMSLSRIEIIALQLVMAGNKIEDITIKFPTKREHEAFLTKLKRLGLS